ncbi:hypothetical protein [Aquibacillus rhizosphaerae]|uniref:YjzC family protein n=1 Tax=Aquibacillus rhizosphaerae TaxID=3051431 RepID=A0ABT7LBA7_9BACI|nr:hypothetical protein [Aquibacillus sp. LR5S19]MDL4843153.1 hypothetical protein [Aquibacillus sp. LR5S19]
MAEREQMYRTGQGVPINGEYVCQSGERRKFTEKDEFPSYPVSGQETTWHWENQQ